MDRILAVLVFLTVHVLGAAVAVATWDPVSEWMRGGTWLSPAVRIPLVAFGIVFAELGLLIAVFPCRRVARRLLGRGRCPPDESCLPSSTAPARQKAR